MVTAAPGIPTEAFHCCILPMSGDSAHCCEVIELQALAHSPVTPKNFAADCSCWDWAPVARVLSA